ncbi:MAG: hypothetical protein ICV78_01495 [Tolypothrix sp. Co-bin9]|nr:hypothetical protein [Tolypothrix sp. Co-bin9]
MEFFLAAIAHNIILHQIKKGDRPFSVQESLSCWLLLKFVVHRVVTDTNYPIIDRFGNLMSDYAS